MNLEFTAKAGFIMYVCMHYLNLARDSSVEPPFTWGAQLMFVLVPPKLSDPTFYARRKFNCKLYFFYKKFYYFHSKAGTYSTRGISTFLNSNFYDFPRKFYFLNNNFGRKFYH